MPPDRSIELSRMPSQRRPAVRSTKPRSCSRCRDQEGTIVAGTIVPLRARRGDRGRAPAPRAARGRARREDGLPGRVVRTARTGDPILDECLAMVGDGEAPRRCSQTWVPKFARHQAAQAPDRGAALPRRASCAPTRTTCSGSSTARSTPRSDPAPERRLDRADPRRPCSPTPVGSTEDGRPHRARAALRPPEGRPRSRQEIKARKARHRADRERATSSARP